MINFEVIQGHGALIVAMLVGIILKSNNYETLKWKCHPHHWWR